MPEVMKAESGQAVAPQKVSKVCRQLVRVYRHALTDKQKEMDKKINAHFEELTAHDTAHA